MGRQNQYRNTISVDGANLGVFDTWEGGEVDSEETKYKPGGMGPEIVLGGSVSVGNVTVGRLYDRARDHDLVRQLITRVGKGQVVGSRQPLDTDANAFGKPLVYTGILKTVTPGDVDSNSDDADVFELEFSTRGSVS